MEVFMTGRISFCANSPVGTYPTPTTNPQANNVATLGFRGKEIEGDYFDKPKKKHSPLLTIGGILVGAAAIIAGLGYTHKADLLNRMKDGKFKDVLKKVADPVTEKCHKWCAAVKTKGLELWNKVFHKKSSS